MKYILSLFVIAAAMVSASAYEISVGPTSAVVMPNRRVKAVNLDAWAATNDYSNGDYAAVGGVACMCLDAGTSGTNAPVLSDIVFADGTVRWVQVGIPQDRLFGLVKKVSGSTSVYLAFGSTATTNSGFCLELNGSGITFTLDDGYNGPVSAISATATNVLRVGEK